jgi:voltage-gated potassium channel Kch
MDSFILQMWGRVLVALRVISPLEWIWWLCPRMRTHGWVDLWVLLNGVAAALTVILAVGVARSAVVCALLLYGGLRIVEIVAYQAKVVLFDEYRQPRSTPDYAVRSYRRIVVLTLHNYVEVICWFAGAYATLNTVFGEKASVVSTFAGALYFSLVTMATVGYGDITPTSSTGRLLVTAQIAIGLFMTLVILARMVSYLPTPRTLDDAEKSNVDRSPNAE